MTIAIVLVVLAAVVLVVRAAVLRWQATRKRQLDDAAADARRWIERLGGQVLTLTGTDTASQQALADAAERYNAAAS
jgi:threonine/homoserine/homoserine lactone efflux protein